MTITLRPFQEEAVASVFAEFADHRATVVVAATGTGKTTIFAEVARRWEGRVLVLAHRSELVNQAALRLSQALGTRVGVDQADRRSTFERVVVGSVQTVHRERRLTRIKGFGKPTLIICDEFHHAPSKSWRTVLDAFPDAKVLGVTATPDRGDKKALGLICDSVAYTYDMPRAIDEGYLVPFRGESIILGDVDLDAIRTTAGDLAAGQLDEEMMAGAEGVAQGLRAYGGDKQGIVFCPGVKTAHFIADRLNQLKPGSAASVDAKTDPTERHLVIEQFKAKKVQWLCNCMIFTEGTDLPTAEVIGMARPTKSRMLYAQMVGRGSRVLPGVVDGVEAPEDRKAAIAASEKPACLILDFVGVGTRHSLATPEDILGGDYDDEEKTAAKQMREEGELGEDATVGDYLSVARAKIREAAQALRASVAMERHTFDPMGDLGVDRENEEARLAVGRAPVTDRQRAALYNMGVPEGDLRALTRTGAKRMLDKMSARRKEGLASLKQLRVLSKHGVGHETVSFQAASQAIDYLAKTGWGRNTNRDELVRMTGAGGEQ